MNALDTNVLVRLITDDDQSMRERAVRLIETAHKHAETLVLPIPVLLEAIWVLGTRYDFPGKRFLTLWNGCCS